MLARAYSVKIGVIFGVQFERRKVAKKSKPTWKLKHANSIVETFEYFCQKTSKSICTILSYTVSKLVHFFETQCIRHNLRGIGMTWEEAQLQTAVNSVWNCSLCECDRCRTFLHAVGFISNDAWKPNLVGVSQVLTPLLFCYINTLNAVLLIKVM